LLTTGAGAFDIKRSPFLFWVFVGKMLRNWLILLVFYQASSLATG
jgi:membrane protein YqaA with SNARE-associated domain